MLHGVTISEWETTESWSDIHLLSLAEGVASGRRLTITDDKGTGPSCRHAEQHPLRRVIPLVQRASDIGEIHSASRTRASQSGRKRG